MSIRGEYTVKHKLPTTHKSACYDVMICKKDKTLLSNEEISAFWKELYKLGDKLGYQLVPASG